MVSSVCARTGDERVEATSAYLKLVPPEITAPPFFFSSLPFLFSLFFSMLNSYTLLLAVVTEILSHFFSVFSLELLFKYIARCRRRSMCIEFEFQFFLLAKEGERNCEHTHKAHALSLTGQHNKTLCGIFNSVDPLFSRSNPTVSALYASKMYIRARKSHELRGL